MNKKGLIIILFSIIFVLGFANADFALAGTGHNVSGWGWAINIGWISFNCTNTGTCGTSNYGVDIDLSAGTHTARPLTGYAWSSNIGWIMFDPPPESSIPATSNYAKIDLTTGRISGWARACAGTKNGRCTGPSRDDGWDGWIKLDTSKGNLRVDTSTGPYYKFYGWASSSADPLTGVIGWLSFNGDNYPGGSDFWVQLDEAINRPPTATISSAPTTEYCSTAPRGIINFQWDYADPDGDSESRFQFQVASVPDFSSLAIDRSFNVNYPNPSKNDQSASIVNYPASGELAYNTTYYWRVKVFDSIGANSGWVAGSNFTTSKHAWPRPDFTWAPANPSAGENTLFTDLTAVYGGAGKAAWSWTFQNGTPSVILPPCIQNPKVVFSSIGDKNVSLVSVMDSDGYVCSGPTKTISVILPLPKWREITPR